MFVGRPGSPKHLDHGYATDIKDKLSKVTKHGSAHLQSVKYDSTL
jgi:hypothetical protein